MHHYQQFRGAIAEVIEELLLACNRGNGNQGRGNGGMITRNKFETIGDRRLRCNDKRELGIAHPGKYRIFAPAENLN
ncbi:hypothetical protein HC931_26345 [Candidatus Gracilibacteria bacterium]|nr:hypothetical protein [Candidatus Gracilibacteria bacterium]